MMTTPNTLFCLGCLAATLLPGTNVDTARPCSTYPRSVLQRFATNRNIWAYEGPSIEAWSGHPAVRTAYGAENGQSGKPLSNTFMARYQKANVSESGLDVIDSMIRNQSAIQTPVVRIVNVAATSRRWRTAADNRS